MGKMPQSSHPTLYHVKLVSARDSMCCHRTRHCSAWLEQPSRASASCGAGTKRWHMRMGSGDGLR